MTYEIRQVKYEDLDRIYPQEEDSSIGRVTYAKREWPQDMHHLSWAVDDANGIFLLSLPMVRLDAAKRYMFGMPGGIAVVRNEGYCLFRFLYVSPGLMGRIDDVKTHIREIFKISGLLIGDSINTDSMFAVPDAQFKD
jgi:hypothetical protein